MVQVAGLETKNVVRWKGGHSPFLVESGRDVMLELLGAVGSPH